MILPSATAREMQSGFMAVCWASVLVPLIAVLADLNRLKVSRHASEPLHCTFLHMDGLCSGTSMMPVSSMQHLCSGPFHQWQRRQEAQMMHALYFPDMHIDCRLCVSPVYVSDRWIWVYWLLDSGWMLQRG